MHNAQLDCNLSLRSICYRCFDSFNCLNSDGTIASGQDKLHHSFAIDDFRIEINPTLAGVEMNDNLHETYQ